MDKTKLIEDLNIAAKNLLDAYDIGDYTYYNECLFRFNEAFKAIHLKVGHN